MAMLFTFEFLIGFVVFFVAYWLLVPWIKIQNIALLLAGYFFVGLMGLYPLMVLLSWSLCVCLLLTLASHHKYRDKTGMVLGIMLATYFIVFKYFMPVSDWLLTLFQAHGLNIPPPAITILLPLGLSFYLFSSVSLVLSVARGEIAHPGVINTLLYISFIPTLIAGPINRAGKLIPQFSGQMRTVLEYKRALCLITLALIKLFLLSSWLNDRFADPVFTYPEGQNGWDTLLAVYGWAWNIYFNFSGYTNLVTGIALLLGFRISPNFAHPYQAASLKEFWRDWHISLSEFIRDYLYFPLGGNRKGFTRTQVNVMVAMVMSGIWHGAGLTFLVWGALHGAGLVIYNFWQRWGVKRLGWQLPDPLARLLTFHFVCLAWIFFAAASCGDAAVILANIAHSFQTAPSSEQAWALCAFTGVILVYPELVRLSTEGERVLCSLRSYALPLVIVPLLALAFFFAPSGLPGFIYAAF
ncbi:MBOAT family O-acyltransferase [Pantoea sp. C2G6]|uniref:MBOAT family O-acyltransferase n=1 Tax=Pantoea sp. C2G6 TaxID=3243084 RepID=UPI003EDA9A58